MTATSTAAALWYLGRGAGVVTLVLLSLTLVIGILTRSGRPLPGLPRFAVAALHRSVSLLAVVMLGVHIVTLTLDPQAQLRWIDAVLPFGAAWRPGWVGLGALSLDVMLALVVTSLLRHRIGRRAWRAVHWTAYASWPLAVFHSLGTGTDVGTGWFNLVLLGCSAAVLAALTWRTSVTFLDPTGRVPGTRRPAPPARPSDRSSDLVVSSR